MMQQGCPATPQAHHCGQIQYGHHLKTVLATTIEPIELQMQTWCLFHVISPLEICWNAYLYDWVYLNLYFAYLKDGVYLKMYFTVP